MKFIARLIILAFAMTLFCSSAFAYDKAVQYIRGLRFNKCTYKTVGQSIDEAFENPRWESGTGNRGEILVNVQGPLTWLGKRYMTVLQFEVLQNGKFKTNAISFNGKVQDDAFLNSFVTELCK